MQKRYTYLFMSLIVIAVLCATAIVYKKQPPVPAVALLAPQSPAVAGIFPAPDKTSYQMRLRLDVSNNILYGTTLLKTQNTCGNKLDELWFTAYPNCLQKSDTTPAPQEAYFAGFNPGWLRFNHVKVNGQEVQFFEKGVSIQVKTASAIAAGDDIQVEIIWQAKIPRLKYRFGSNNTVYMLGNFYPALNVLTKDGWLNSYNSVFGDPFCFQTAYYAVSLNIPNAYNMVATGRTVSRTTEDDGRDTYLIEARDARDFSLLVMYDYTEIKQEIKGVTVKCYFPGQHTEVAQKVLRKSGQILSYYASRFGSYPYEEFKVAFVPMQGFHGMEYCGLIFLREDFLQQGYEPERSEFILAHEIAHQWWYGMVGNDQLREPWLDEGLANWSAYKYLQEIEGKQIPSGLEYRNGMDLGKEMRDIFSSQEYYRTAYTGGESFWFGLEKELGNDRVIKVLRRYLADYKNKIATTQDLMDIIKMEAGQDMSEYIYKWFPPKP
ncbi:MAG: M1 family metallopeptidase [Syntrophomonas sp.]|nr:M1 family metallopeptidase [Syntrophomonas sp.]